MFKPTTCIQLMPLHIKTSNYSHDSWKVYLIYAFDFTSIAIQF